MKKKNQKSENQLKKQQSAACFTYKNEIKKNSPVLNHKRSIYKLKEINMLQKGGSILFNLVVVF